LTQLWRWPWSCRETSRAVIL